MSSCHAAQRTLGCRQTAGTRLRKGPERLQEEQEAGGYRNEELLKDDVSNLTR